jgi:hypothetical protein
VEAAVRALFERYAEFFNRAIGGTVDLDQITAVYTPEFISASPRGVMTGKNDDSLKPVMERGYAHYRAIGTKEMRIQELQITPIDDLHCFARVGWKAIYDRKGAPDVEIDFDVHYLVQNLDGHPKIFGWVTGDEEATLRKHGIG